MYDIICYCGMLTAVHQSTCKCNVGVYNYSPIHIGICLMRCKSMNNRSPIHIGTDVMRCRFVNARSPIHIGIDVGV